MGRRKKGQIINGWINLDKPVGMSSTQALGKVRWLLDAQKAGHGGTLDPLATGILPIALGEATKTIAYCQDHLKSYSFAVIWGEERTTDDAEGEVTATSDVRPEAGAIEDILQKFTGDIDQIPPRFSAIKIDGERAYDLARDGQEVELAARTVYIDHLELLESGPDRAHFYCVCGKGTYMRSLARDMARALGTLGYIADLRRESVGPFTLNNAVTLEELEKIANGESDRNALLPVEIVLNGLPSLPLNEQEAALLKNGQVLNFISRPDVERLQRAGLNMQDGDTALAICRGRPIALVDILGVEVRPLRVLNL